MPNAVIPVRRAVACGMAAACTAVIVTPFWLGQTPRADGAILVSAALAGLGYWRRGWWPAVFYGSTAPALVALLVGLPPAVMRAATAPSSWPALLLRFFAGGALGALVFFGPPAWIDVVRTKPMQLPRVELRTKGRVAAWFGVGVGTSVAVHYAIKCGCTDFLVGYVLLTAAVGAGAGFLVVTIVLYPVVESAAYMLRLTATALAYLVDYLLARVAAIATFVLGYVFIAAWFSRWFQLISRADPRGFGGQLGSEPTYLDFFYLSVVTLTTLGYGDIVPATRLARAAVTLEVIAGVLWTTIVLAGIVGMASDRFTGTLGVIRDDSSDPDTV